MADFTVTFDVPAGARVGDAPISRGAMTVDQIVDEINAGGRESASVVDRERGVIKVSANDGPLLAGTWAKPELFVVGRSRLYRDPHDKLAENPCARRHHHPDCRWKPGKRGSSRGWWCVEACPVPALLDAADPPDSY